MRELISTLTARPLEKLLYLVIFLTIAVIMTTPYYYLAVVPALLIIILAVSYRYPIYAYYAIIFLIPFGAYRNVSDVGFLRLHWVLAAILTLYMLFRAFQERHLPDELKSRLWPFVVLLFVVDFISSMFSPYPATAFHDVALFAVGGVFVLISMYFIDKKALFNYLPVVVVVSVSLSSLFGVLGYVFDVSFFAEKIEAGQFKRSLGGSTDPNNYVLMITFAFPILFALFDRARRPALKALYLGLAAINIMAVIFSFSRGGAAISLMVLLVIFVKYIKRQAVHLVFVQVFAVLLAAFLIVGMLPENYIVHFKNIANPQADVSIDRRSTYLVVGLESFYRHPIIGTGLGTFRDIYSESTYARKFAKEGSTNRRYAHNTYLEYLVGTGILGAVLFVCLIVMAARNYIDARKNFLSKGDFEGASFAGTYLFSFVVLMIYLFIYSDPFHKFLLLSLGLSQVTYRLSLPGKK
ncbi:O-antigen ligase family protein [Candidatus Magnetominusculus xianensis]|uniref:O-antigen polymerase n=1 Tax=Candidatus Magnetominusculus xianensis TaxID=1748249 RepID=A0ABR5SHA1_9BACT|nr:O-antigen ligase family protein [Candidatus Magnetominusculus xianensis]KWT82979.1 O-antigen polymerase [Candidatus Magnetominusculus xianensis]MBF0403058.1 O-antigen ligase family protein [Nitrospirota bacterium]